MSTLAGARPKAAERSGSNPGVRTGIRLGVMMMLVPFALASCGGSGDDSSSEDGGASEASADAVVATTCVASTGSLAAGASLAGWAGEYSLTMVAGDEGAETGSVEGGLVLRDQSTDLRHFAGSDGSAIPGVASPLLGTTDIAVQVVGALRIGDLSSADPAAPGVLVIESQTAQGPSILLRFGSDANRRDMVLFDGGFTVLELSEVGDNGFKGTWTSGAQRSRKTGYFCAERVPG